MNFCKTAISLILLLTYSLGFTHNLVPHCSEFLNGNHNNTHQHHEHVEGEQGDNHSHVSHNNHLDEGVFDFLLCLASETNESGTECVIEHCFTINPSAISLKDAIDVPTTIVLLAVFQPIIQKNTNSKFFIAAEKDYRSPLTENSPLRGPPFIS